MAVTTERTDQARTLTLTLRFPRRTLLGVMLACFSIPLVDVLALNWFASAPGWLSVTGGALLAAALAVLDAYDAGRVSARPGAQLETRSGSLQ